MDGKLWKQLYAKALKLCDSRRGARQQFSDLEILVWYLWAVWHDRPLSWLSWLHNSPPELKGRRRPSPATLSRRLRSLELKCLLERLERELTAPREEQVCKYIDAKPLPIGHTGKDPDARYGRTIKGYRLYVITDKNHQLYAWRVLPNN